MSLVQQLKTAFEYVAKRDKQRDLSIQELITLITASASFAGRVGGVVDWSNATIQDLTSSISTVTANSLSSYSISYTAPFDCACTVDVTLPASLTDSALTSSYTLSIAIDGVIRQIKPLSAGTMKDTLYSVPSSSHITAIVIYPTSIGAAPSSFTMSFFPFTIASWDESNFNPVQTFLSVI